MTQEKNQNTSSSETAKSPALRPWLRGLLLVSLALNLAVLGLVAGAFFRFGGPDSDKRPPRVDQIAGTYTRALSSEDRRAIWRQMRQNSEGMPGRAEMRADMAEVLQVLRAETFDRTALSRVMARQLRFGHQRAELGQSLLIERLSDMSQAERRAYADRLEEGMKKRKHGHKSKGGHQKDGARKEHRSQDN